MLSSFLVSLNRSNSQTSGKAQTGKQAELSCNLVSQVSCESDFASESVLCFSVYQSFRVSRIATNFSGTARVCDLGAALNKNGSHEDKKVHATESSAPNGKPAYPERYE